MMLALADIRHDLLRFVLTAIGIGLLAMGAFGMTGIYRGIVADALMVIDRIGADLWVVQGDTRGPFAETSAVPLATERRVEGVDGVIRVRPFLSLTRSLRIDGQVRQVSLLGLDWPDDDGGWLPLAEGLPLGQRHDVAIADRSLGLAIGDVLVVGHQHLRVTGLTRDMVDINGDPVLALTIPDLIELRAARPSEAILLRRAAGSAGDHGDVQALAVDVRPGAAISVAAEIAGWGDVAVLTTRDQRDLLLNARLERLRMQILLFSLLLMTITAVVVSLILYTGTIEKLHTIAMLKLIGAADRLIVAMIATQALALGVTGLGVGLAAGRLLFPVFPRRVLLLDADIALIGAMVLATCLAGSAAGIVKAMRVRAQEVLA
ncbi:ABC transporter permease [uncultured Tistrella sp.]|uniref:ABC transporter permease n=1 Tax=Tistrella mobilis TaxID=171437 RepID=UPI000C09411A|nr:ABC transporter permease [uncultured Tistrella sp.]MAM76666.1 multidrug ABC transporter substrate-binding protein [Tistrella sp.]